MLFVSNRIIDSFTLLSPLPVKAQVSCVGTTGAPLFPQDPENIFLRLTLKSFIELSCGVFMRHREVLVAGEPKQI